MEGFGEAKFGSKKTYFKLKDGDSTFRIIGPIGHCQPTGTWHKFYRIHYGYKNSEGKMRTFESPLVVNQKTKMVEVQDAAVERIQTLTAQLKAAQDSGNKELTAKLLKLVGGQKSQFNLDSNHYLNVIDTQGNVGVLKIRHRCKQALDVVIKKLREGTPRVEPLSPDNGRWFVFNRSGTGRDTTYTVTVLKEKLEVANVGTVERDVVHTITEDLAKRIIAVKGKDSEGNPIYDYREGANLLTLFKKPTSEEVARIVKEGSSAVDEILDSKGSKGGATYDGDDDTGSEDDDLPSSLATTGTNAAPANLGAGGTTTPQSPTVTVTATPAAQTLQSPVVQAAPAPTPTTTPKTSSIPATTADSVASQTDEDFLKSLNIPV